MIVRTFFVPELSCAHRKAEISRELEAVAGVRAVDVDLDAKLVRVHTYEGLDDALLVAALDGAGYDAERVSVR